MTLEDLCEYKAQKRIKQYEQGVPLRCVWLRKHLHPLVIGFLIADKIQQKEKVVVLGDKSHREKGVPVIYACNHIGGNEIERAFLAIKNRLSYAGQSRNSLPLTDLAVYADERCYIN